MPTKKLRTTSMSRELNADGHGTDALLVVHLRLQVSR